MILKPCLRSLSALKTSISWTQHRAINIGQNDKRIVQQLIKDEDEDNSLIKVTKLFNRVNDVIIDEKCGQNFAVVHVFGRQHVVHMNDIISYRNSFEAKVGEIIKLEKCLLVGNNTFTLIGRPLLSRDLVQIEATVLEKTMTHTYYNVKSIPRNHGYRRWRFQRYPLTMLRINRIDICHQLNQTQQIVN
ncbi:39S ribosomal protein L21, mitochondrial-like [Oppia nitens]|uniref:39S ribosomal protein L21, mitochondrial-like n=1 Tax=Oppia nitens TaxID=1686743 RepID=UPI0023DA1716|nr:39S ribosomal protein L21, mitochondrial-like [Oppia nitens]